MEFDLTRLSSGQCYKLLAAVVVPRPIALVTSVSADDRVNAAPFSYFNLMGHDPPVVAIGLGNRTRETPKDTVRNVRETGEWVVNIVSEDIADAMNRCATDFPYGVDELARAGLTPAPSVAVRPPRVAESPIHLECREVTRVEVGRTRVLLGRVVHAHFRDGLVDPDRFYVDTPSVRIIGRMHGRGWYVRTTDLFELQRVPYPDRKNE